MLPENCKVHKKTGSELSNEGVSQLEKDLEKLKESGGGVVFVDEAYQLDSSQGHRVLDFILGHSERMKGKFGSLIWIFAGYANKMDDLFKHNVGLPSRFPCKFIFEDYTDPELLSILTGLMERGGNDVIPTGSSSDQENESAVPSKPKQSVLKINNYNSYLTHPYANRPDETDEWGNIWHWDASNFTFYDDYDNISGIGASGLGSASNPLVSRTDNTKWIFDRLKRHWCNQNTPTKTSSSYPGKPAPKKVVSAALKQKFVVTDEKWLRIAVRRLGRLRGAVGFGNARAVRNLFDLSHGRQVKRISFLRSRGFSPDIFSFERNDLLGPKATEEALMNSSAWQELMKMEGLVKVKEALQQFLDLVVDNADREDREQNILNTVLNRIFLGNPGTGSYFFLHRIFIGYDNIIVPVQARQRLPSFMVKSLQILACCRRAKSWLGMCQILWEVRSVNLRS